MRYFVGLVMAGAALLGQAPAADAQVTLGNPNSGYSVTVGRQNPYGTNAYGQPVPAYPQSYQPGTRYYNYNTGYRGYTTYPSTPAPYYNPQPPVYGTQQPYGYPTYGNTPNPYLGQPGVTITGPGGVSASIPLRSR